MKEQTVRSEVEIDFKDGRGRILMAMKKPLNIKDCEKGKLVTLNLRNGDQWNGIFNGMDGEEYFKLLSLSGKNAIGVKIEWIDNYFEQVKPQPNEQP